MRESERKRQRVRESERKRQRDRHLLKHTEIWEIMVRKKNRDLHEKQTGRHVKLRKDTENNRQGVFKLHFSMQ